MRRSISRLLIGLFAAPLMMISSAASAGSNPCGNIDLAASGKCEYRLSGGCTASCTPLSFEAACDAACTIQASANCTAGCEGSCVAECTAKPAEFTCEGQCGIDCQAGCESKCTDSGCVASCQSRCDERCAVECKASPPSASCEAQCQVSCGASCEVEANATCRFGCETKLTGGCTAQCSEPEGALFCDGQYVDAADNFDACVDYLENGGFLNASGEFGCSGGECTGSVSVGGCSAAPGAIDDGVGVGAIAGLMLGLGMIVSRRRRRG